MKCLEDLVGHDGCTTPDTLYTLSDVGISPKQIGEFRDDAWATDDAFLDSVKRLAAANLVSDILTVVSPGVAAARVLKTGMVGGQGKAETINGLRGLRLKVRRPDTYSRINIPRISITTTPDRTVTLNLIDLVTGTVIAEHEVSVTDGRGTIHPDDLSLPLTEAVTDLALVYDADGTTARSANLSKGCSSCGSSKVSTVEVSGIEITATTPSVATRSTSTSSGLTVDYSVDCDTEAWVCSIRKHLALPYLYGVAKQLFENALKSGGRFTEQKTANYAANEERHHLAEYHYREQLKAVTRSVRFPRGGCFSCNPATRVRTIVG